MTTKRDFVMAAGIIATISDAIERRSVAQDFAVYFAAQNPRFQAERFINAVETERARIDCGGREHDYSDGKADYLQGENR